VSYGRSAHKPGAGAETKSATRDVTRVQLDLPPRSMQRLTALKELTEASSYAEVIRNTLQLYEGLIRESQDGKRFLVEDKTGKQSPLPIFL
jgi:hypothetical protein